MRARRQEIEDIVSNSLAAHGLAVAGWFRIEVADMPPEARPSVAEAPALLIGNRGGAMWKAFSAAPEFGDGAPHPLDRWTLRVIGEIGAGLNLSHEMLFPFGPTLWPFQRWARRAMGIGPSPLGILIHPQFGLWHALRAVIAFPGLGVEIRETEPAAHPCDDCRDKPCLSACPVGAFEGSGFAVAACRGHLCRPDREPDCMRLGCLARAACPVGRQWRYRDEQIRFHMRSFAG